MAGWGCRGHNESERAICIVRWQMAPSPLPLLLPPPTPVCLNHLHPTWASHLSPGSLGRPRAQSKVGKRLELGAKSDLVGYASAFNPPLPQAGSSLTALSCPEIRVPEPKMPAHRRGQHWPCSGSSAPATAASSRSRPSSAFPGHHQSTNPTNGSAETLLGLSS